MRALVNKGVHLISLDAVWAAAHKEESVMLSEPSRRHWTLLLIVAVGVLAFDQFSKWVITNTIQPYDSVPLLPPVLYLTHSFNTGAAFGVFPDGGIIFLFLAVVIVIFMLFTYPKVKSQISRVAIGLVIGGALGNVADRLQYGHVIDFVHIVVPNIVSNVSNFADHAIVLGVLIFAAQNWREERHEKQRKAIEDDTNVTLPVETPFGEPESPKE
jgi:signal peptidase II